MLLPDLLFTYAIALIAELLLISISSCFTHIIVSPFARTSGFYNVVLNLIGKLDNVSNASHLGMVFSLKQIRRYSGNRWRWLSSELVEGKSTIAFKYILYSRNVYPPRPTGIKWHESARGVIPQSSITIFSWEAQADSVNYLQQSSRLFSLLHLP